jgi:tRNA-splicing ligase RtcB
MPFIHSHIAVMPDVHFGIGATVGSVIPTKGAIIPAAVGVDIGCGMMAVRTSLTANDLPDSLSRLRGAIERNVPHGNGPNGNHRDTPSSVETSYRDSGLERSLPRDHRQAPEGVGEVARSAQLGTLGGGNHFIEVCLDERTASG